MSRYTGGKLPDYIKDTDLPLLGSSLPVVMEDGNWTSVLVEFESQIQRGVESIRMCIILSTYLFRDVR